MEQNHGEWYTGNIGLTVTAGTDTSSGVKSIKYKITGAINKGETEVGVGNGQTTGALQSITNDGTSTVEAWTIDNAGHESSHATLSVKKDSTPPSSATITYKSKTANTITVSASGQDATSGVKSYTYQYKVSSSNDADSAWSTGATGQGTNYTYPSSIIQAGKTYDVRVLVYDNAGNYTRSSKQTVVLNTAPTFEIQGYCSTKTNVAMTIKAKAKDNEGDRLTYTLYMGTSQGSLSQKATTSGNSGAEVTLNASGLSSYTGYYWRVDVSDGTVTTTGTVNSARTYCYRTHCNGGTSKICSGCRRTWWME